MLVQACWALAMAMGGLVRVSRKAEGRPMGRRSKVSAPVSIWPSELVHEGTDEADFAISMSNNLRDTVRHG